MNGTQPICISNKDDHVLTEQDFYPPSDNRVLESNIEDIDEDNNFVNYCEELFGVLEEEEYFDN